MNRFSGRASYPPGHLKVNTRQVYLLNLCHHPRGNKPTAHLVDQLGQRFVVRFDVAYLNPTASRSAT